MLLGLFVYTSFSMLLPIIFLRFPTYLNSHTFIRYHSEGRLVLARDVFEICGGARQYHQYSNYDCFWLERYCPQLPRQGNLLRGEPSVRGFLQVFTEH